MTEKQVSEVIAMHERGAPIDGLAESFGIHRTTVMTLAERYDVDAETVRRAFSQAGISLRPRRGWQY